MNVTDAKDRITLGKALRFTRMALQALDEVKARKGLAGPEEHLGDAAAQLQAILERGEA